MRIAAAVSGGRDSLLALALLAQARRSTENPLAVHAFLAQATPPDVLEILRENCRVLGVQLVVADLREEFDALVVQPYVRAYLDGLTPNPCVWCNSRIKFGLLLDVARSHGAQTLATGHYARMRQGRDGPELWRGADLGKDQSYFLALLHPEQLRQAAFPLADVLKQEALARLETLGLVPALPEESQEVCFIPKDYREFLAGRSGVAAKPGPIVLPDGSVVGGHQGLWNHTIGQRRGLNIAWSEPLYVLAKDAENNRLVVGPRRDLRGGSCLLEQINLLVPLACWPQDVFVQTRYRQQPVALGPVHEVLRSWPRLTLPCSSDPPAPGQLAVFYSGQGQVLAGAMIGRVCA